MHTARKTALGIFADALRTGYIDSKRIIRGIYGARKRTYYPPQKKGKKEKKV